MNLLEINNLAVDIEVEDMTVHAVRNANLFLKAGKVLVLAGESGSGKSITALSITGILPEKAKVIKGSICFEGRYLLTLAENELRRIRGGMISYIFQEPAAYFNPVMTIGRQISEALIYHRKMSARDSLAEAVRLLELTRINEPRTVIDQYPHQLSGGMNQRAMIAMALASKPKLLIADEPTTALDVITEDEILRLILSLKDEFGFGVLFITHDFSVVNRVADDIAVMYRGEVVEQGSKSDIFANPRHEHIKELIGAYEQIYCHK